MGRHFHLTLSSMLHYSLNYAYLKYKAKPCYNVYNVFNFHWIP